MIPDEGGQMHGSGLNSVMILDGIAVNAPHVFGQNVRGEKKMRPELAILNGPLQASVKHRGSLTEGKGPLIGLGPDFQCRCCLD